MMQAFINTSKESKTSIKYPLHIPQRSLIAEKINSEAHKRTM